MYTNKYGGGCCTQGPQNNSTGNVAEWGEFYRPSVTPSMRIFTQRIRPFLTSRWLKMVFTNHISCIVIVLKHGSQNEDALFYCATIYTERDLEHSKFNIISVNTLLFTTTDFGVYSSIHKSKDYIKIFTHR